MHLSFPAICLSFPAICLSFPARPKTPPAPPAHTRSPQISYTKTSPAVSQLGPSPAPILVLPIFRPARSGSMIPPPLDTDSDSEDSQTGFDDWSSPGPDSDDSDAERPHRSKKQKGKPLVTEIFYPTSPETGRQGTARLSPRGCSSTAISKSTAAGPTP
ncbi:hypothetical protein P167DRAFT_543858 [Morchella conica CCBAS932]|uniref:Uncharacterized protein n=1 Tax=Morchella conica CCBAS932 TaxID=1392247 RepID=A0A3N4KUQ8_9PEZI|nr:hypothetical protein P167DRAFT_543858 [Morchella conica CCBAS932]